MKFSRLSRFVSALVALACVLFAQLAIAAYACPGTRIGQEAATVRDADGARHRMPDCEEMDIEQPALCHAHPQAGDQSLDKPGTPNLPPIVAVLLVFSIENFEAAYFPAASYAAATRMRRSSGPPLSIRNCCFRI